MNVEGQYNPKDVECISVENLEVLPSGADWQSRHLESERRKAEIRDRIHKQAEQGQKSNHVHPEATGIYGSAYW